MQNSRNSPGILSKFRGFSVAPKPRELLQRRTDSEGAYRREKPRTKAEPVVRFAPHQPEEKIQIRDEDEKYLQFRGWSASRISAQSRRSCGISRVSFCCLLKEKRSLLLLFHRTSAVALVLT
ncbi:hypothetical protein AGIG_G18176 [Arapaima gigas]